MFICFLLIFVTTSPVGLRAALYLITRFSTLCANVFNMLAPYLAHVPLSPLRSDLVRVRAITPFQPLGDHPPADPLGGAKLFFSTLTARFTDLLDCLPL